MDIPVFTSVPDGYSPSVVLIPRTWSRMTEEQRSAFHHDYVEFAVIMTVKELLAGRIPFELYLGVGDDGDIFQPQFEEILA